MDFKDKYKKALDEAGSIGELSKKSYSIYADKYARPESPDHITNILAGKIFTFYYSTKFKSSEGGWINRRPILFIGSRSIDSEKEIIRGIDLMLLKPLDRLNFFIRFFKIYEKPISHNISVKNQTHGAQMPMKIDMEMMETLFGGISYKYAYAGFKIENIVGMKEIEIDDWHNLVFLNTKSIEGMSIEDIYNKFN